MKYIICTILLCYSMFLTAQGNDGNGVYSFEDGEVADIEDLLTDPSDFPKHEIYAGGFIIDGLYGYLGYAFTIPKKIQISAMGAGNGGALDATFTIKSFQKTIEQGVTIGTKYTGEYAPDGRRIVNKYHVTIPVERVRSLAVTSRVEYFNLSTGEESNFPALYDTDVVNVILGASLVTTKNVRYTINEKYKKRKAVTSRYFIGFTYISPLTDIPESADMNVKTIVPRFTYELSTSVTPSGRHGIRVLIGYQSPTGFFGSNNPLLGGIAYRLILG